MRARQLSSKEQTPGVSQASLRLLSCSNSQKAAFKAEERCAAFFVFLLFSFFWLEKRL
jgi:hypothetical protein